MLHLIIIMLCLHISITVVTFPGKYESLYCSKEEIDYLFAQGACNRYKQCQSKKNKDRLKELQKKKSDFFWHLFDVYIGKKKSENLQNKLVHNFEFDDFLTNKGRKVKIVTIDSLPIKKNNKLNSFCKIKANSHQIHNNSNLLAMSYVEMSSLIDFWQDDVKKIKMTHGFQNCHLIRELAPTNIEIIIISIFDECGHANKEDFLQALHYCNSLKPDILLLSLKFENFNYKKNKIDKEINKLLYKFPYVVAASGNNGIATEAYPAKLKGVTFDVGAYDKLHNVCTFSQYEKNIGPKIVAPGKDIMSIGLTPSKDAPQFIFNSGTSMAAALIAGFLATILSEYSDSFTRKEILNIIYHCTDKNDMLCSRSLLGAIDMRECLFACKVISLLQKNKSKKIICNNSLRKTLERISFLNNFCNKNLDQNEIKGFFVKTLNCYASNVDQLANEFLKLL